VTYKEAEKLIQHWHIGDADWEELENFLFEQEQKLYKIAALAYSTRSPLEGRMADIRALVYDVYKEHKELKVKI